MKLHSDIKPRRDGTVTAMVGEKSYVFSGSPLAAEVDDADVAFLLNTGSFYPADAEDFERAGVKLSNALSSSEENDEADDDDDEDDEIIGDGAPLEALTPVKPSKRAKKVK